MSNLASAAYRVWSKLQTEQLPPPGFRKAVQFFVDETGLVEVGESHLCPKDHKVLFPNPIFTPNTSQKPTSSEPMCFAVD